MRGPQDFPGLGPQPDTGLASIKTLQGETAEPFVKNPLWDLSDGESTWNDTADIDSRATQATEPIYNPPPGPASRSRTLGKPAQSRRGPKMTKSASAALR